MVTVTTSQNSIPKPDMNTRRNFLKQTSTAATALAFYGAAGAFTRAQSPNSRLRVAVMGLQRGLDLVNATLGTANSEVAYVCEVDSDRLARGMQVVTGKQKAPVKAEKDVRRILDDKEVDVLFVAAPNHWHAPATILGCSAGKHVYVEKPCSHNPWEGEMMVKAARKNNRVVQMG